MTDSNRAGETLESNETADLEAMKGSGWSENPPSWGFHGLLALGALPVLWAASFPGLSLGWILLGLLIWLIMGVVWVTRLIQYCGHSRRFSGWFLVAPIMFVLVVLLVVTDVPLKARWAESRSDFDAALGQLPDTEDSGGANQRIGSYNITGWYRVDQGVIFPEATGSLMDDAGFAYLPNGPSPALDNGSFESPEFVHLGGSWYAWTASW